MSESLLSAEETDQFKDRVDASACDEKWWSDVPETEADVDRRLQELWRRVLEEALLKRFGGDGYYRLSFDDSESGASWQVVDSHELQRVKEERLQNCGVLGLRCVLEDPEEELDDDWELVPQTRWVAKDALLMFNSVLRQ